MIFHYSPGGAPRLCLIECLVGCDDEGAGGEEDRAEDGEGDDRSSGGRMEHLGTGAGVGVSREGKP